MKEKIPKNAGELEDIDKLDEGLVSSGPETVDDADALDPGTGLPLEEVESFGLHVEGESEEV
jgi:hypothetical protein